MCDGECGGTELGVTSTAQRSPDGRAGEGVIVRCGCGGGSGEREGRHGGGVVWGGRCGGPAAAAPPPTTAVSSCWK
jgi:hypothetical protein